MAEETTSQVNTDGKTTEASKTETTSLVNTEAKTEGTVDGKTDTTAKTEAPAEYKDFKLPEGVEADAEVLASFKAEAKALKLTQEQAQKLVDMQTSLAAKQSKTAHDAWTDVQKDWVEKAKSDKEYGGQAFNDNLALAKKAMDKFASPEFKQAMDLTGMGNHPELIRLLVNVGKHFKEDGVMKSGTESAGTKDPAKVLFPNMA